jgi:hypothetical protein
MRAKGYTAITLAVVGLLLSLTLYGLTISWIFLIPAVILARTESKRIFSETGKTAGTLVVFQVLSWISLGLSGLLIFTFGSIFLRPLIQEPAQSQQSDQQGPMASATVSIDPFLSEHNRQYLVIGYGATVDPISVADAERIKSWQTYFALWNENTAKIFRDYNDPAITPTQFVSYCKSYLDALREALIRIGYGNSQTDDPGIKAMIVRLLEIRGKTLTGWTAVQKARASNDPALEQTALLQLEEARQTELAFSEEMTVRIKAAGMDVEKDRDYQKTVDRTLEILKSPRSQ